jgi:hypothetical protein
MLAAEFGLAGYLRRMDYGSGKERFSSAMECAWILERECWI